MRQIIQLIFILFTFNFSAQELTDEIEPTLFIIDTTTYNGDTIYVFNDKSWEYSKDYHVQYTLKTIESSKGYLMFDSLELFKTNWSMTKTFSNQYNLANINDSVTLDISGFSKPVSNSLTSGFKFRWGRWHKGNDFGCASGTKVYPAWDGVVRYAQMNYGGYGNLVIIRHYNGLETYYAHLSRINVVPGNKITKDEVLGLSGNTGASKGPHLHFEIRFLDNAIDPGVIKGNTLVIHSRLFYYEKKSETISIKDILKIGTKTSEEEIVTEKKQTTSRTRRRTASNMN